VQQVVAQIRDKLPGGPVSGCGVTLFKASPAIWQQLVAKLQEKRKNLCGNYLKLDMPKSHLVNSPLTKWRLRCLVR
jgi:hypothetical protein